MDDDDLIQEMGLLIPNLELSTGCSPSHLPGNPPTTLAQALSYRILSLLHTANILDPNDLKIETTIPKTDDDIPDEGPSIVTKAYWVLYIDILCISLDGNAFDTAWTATIAALQNTVLPKAWWDADREMILCSPSLAETRSLRLRLRPMTFTFAVFSTASPLKQPDDAQAWVLADPDAIEEQLAYEVLTIAVASTAENGIAVLRLEKNGGVVIGTEAVASCVNLAAAQLKLLLGVLDGA
jgi:exosome complex component RRP43